MSEVAIFANLRSALKHQLDAGGYAAFASQLCIDIVPEGLAACPRRDETSGTQGRDEEPLMNPMLRIKIPSAEDTLQDIWSYRAIPSLREYLLISRKKRQVEQYARVDDTTWILRFWEAGSIELPSLDVTLSLDEIYRGVFDP